VRMFSLAVIRVFIAFLFSYLAIYEFNSLTILGGDFSDWLSLLIADGNKILFTIALLVVAMLFIAAPARQSFKALFTNRVGFVFYFGKWQSISLLILVVDFYFYLIVNLHWYLTIPVSIAWLTNQVFSKESSPRKKIIYQKSYFH